MKSLWTLSLSTRMLGVYVPRAACMLQLCYCETLAAKMKSSPFLLENLPVCLPHSECGVAQKRQTTVMCFLVIFLLFRTNISMCRVRCFGGSRNLVGEALGQCLGKFHLGRKKKIKMVSAQLSFSCYKRFLCSTILYFWCLLQLNQSN